MQNLLRSPANDTPPKRRNEWLPPPVHQQEVGLRSARALRPDEGRGALPQALPKGQRSFSLQLVNGGFPLFGWKQQHVSNGCKMEIRHSGGDFDHGKIMRPGNRKEGREALSNKRPVSTSDPGRTREPFPDLQLVVPCPLDYFEGGDAQTTDLCPSLTIFDLRTAIDSARKGWKPL